MKKIKDLEILLHKIDEYDDRSIIYEIIHKDFIEI